MGKDKQGAVMGREALLRQKREFDQAMKDVMQRHKEPASIKYELQNESGGPAVTWNICRKTICL
jgi:hypothetical protein